MTRLAPPQKKTCQEKPEREKPGGMLLGKKGIRHPKEKAYQENPERETPNDAAASMSKKKPQRKDASDKCLV